MEHGKEVVTFRKGIFEISLFNLHTIRGAYADVLDLRHIVHLPINIINHTMN